MDIIKAHEAKIHSGAVTLGDLAPTESDCSSARKRGDLGYFGRGDMQKEFEDASFALKPGEMSSIIETASGLHLIERYAELCDAWTELLLTRIDSSNICVTSSSNTMNFTK